MGFSHEADVHIYICGDIGGTVVINITAALIGTRV
jgi:hypothetical protein